jgi:hypothetical protein
VPVLSARYYLLRVGYEQRVSKNKPSTSSLFVFDPNVLGNKLLHKLLEGRGWQMLVKRGSHTLHNDEYQIVYVEPGLMDVGSEEYNRAKILTSDTHKLWTKKEEGNPVVVVAAAAAAEHSRGSSTSGMFGSSHIS